MQSVFSSPPRLATSRPDLDMVRRVAEAKNALHYVTPRHTEKLRKWPPNTCGMAFDSLILWSDDICTAYNEMMPARNGEDTCQALGTRSEVHGCALVCHIALRKSPPIPQLHAELAAVGTKCTYGQRSHPRACVLADRTHVPESHTSYLESGH